MSQRRKRWKRIGARVEAVRRANGWSRTALARQLLLPNARAVEELEKARRMPTIRELEVLAKLADKSLEYFTDPMLLAHEGEFCWRIGEAVPQEDLDRLEEQAKMWVGLLRWMLEKEGALNRRGRPVLTRLGPSASQAAARTRGEVVAQRLGLGSVPAESLEMQMHAQLGVAVLYMDERLDGNLRRSSATSGICHTEELDVVLLNRHRPLATRRFNLARGLFYVLTWGKIHPPVHREASRIDFRTVARKDHSVARLADHFAAGLLVPPEVLARHIKPARSYGLTYLTNLAAKLQVPPVVLSWRLRGHLRIRAEVLEKLAQQIPPHDQGPTPRLFSAGFVHLLLVALNERNISLHRAIEITGLRQGGLDYGDLAHLFMEYGLEPPRDL